jgi:hypothetical protein
MQFYKIYFIILLLSSVLLGCSKDEGDDSGYSRVKIENNSSSELTNISLGMVGSTSTMSIDRLAAGSSTDYYEFIKPDIRSGDPSALGDYSGEYTQGGMVKSIAILNPSISIITIKIEDDSYTYEGH